jgi:hypothetical protein
MSRDQQWYACSDELVERIDTSKVKTSRGGQQASRDAYMLVYKRRCETATDALDPPVDIMSNVDADNAVHENDRKEWLAK